MCVLKGKPLTPCHKSKHFFLSFLCKISVLQRPWFWSYTHQCKSKGDFAELGCTSVKGRAEGVGSCFFFFTLSHLIMHSHGLRVRKGGELVNSRGNWSQKCMDALLSSRSFVTTALYISAWSGSLGTGELPCEGRVSSVHICGLMMSTFVEMENLACAQVWGLAVPQVLVSRV